MALRRILRGISGAPAMSFTDKRGGLRLHRVLQGFVGTSQKIPPRSVGKDP